MVSVKRLNRLAIFLWGFFLLAGVFFSEFPRKESWTLSNTLLYLGCASLGLAFFTYGLDIRGRTFYKYYFYTFTGAQIPFIAKSWMAAGVIVWLFLLYIAFRLTF